MSETTVKNPDAVQLGRLGGRKGGLAAAAQMTAEQRSDRARNAVQRRWKTGTTTPSSSAKVAPSKRAQVQWAYQYIAHWVTVTLADMVEDGMQDENFPGIDGIERHWRATALRHVAAKLAAYATTLDAPR